MATNAQTTTKTPAEKKPAKPPVPAAQRITEQLKRAALGGKITKEELASVANLAQALQTFISTP